MSYSCSQCSFSSQFESALMMHRQLHHMGEVADIKPNLVSEKSSTLPRASTFNSHYFDNKESKGLKLPSRTSSATRLFDKLRARICRSRTLFAHPEESGSTTTDVNELSIPSDCTSKAMKSDSLSTSRTSAILCPKELQKETYGCHLCSFDADRITALDRHLLNDHKIGLDILLKLVMAKTKDGLSEDPMPTIYGDRQPYYRPLDDIIEEGEFIVETVTPKIKILKHTATNTEIQWTDIPDLKNNCRMITKELEKLIQRPSEGGNEELLAKMQTLNACMCKFADSSNVLTKALKKEIDAKSTRGRLSGNDTLFELGLGDRGTPRDWERAHSEKLERNKAKYSRGDKTKLSSESFYF